MNAFSQGNKNAPLSASDFYKGGDNMASIEKVQRKDGISANTDIKTVSSRLGHSNTSTTLNIYAHSLRKADKNAANAFDDIINKK